MKKKRLAKMILSLAAVLVIGSTAGCGASSSTTTETAQASSETSTEISSETTEETTTVALPTEPITFYLFGCDTQGVTPEDNYRSDLIKIIQIDPQNKTIKATGILRDSKVPIEGHDDQKINAAYMYGRADLAMSTINNDFDLDIHQYISINFANTIRLIDDIGGIDVEVTDEEIVGINYFAADFTDEGRMDNTEELTASGKVHLNGCQALAFSRTRKIDSDYFRSARQNKVLIAIIEKLKEMPATEYPQIISDFAQCAETNMSLDDISLWTLMDLGSYTFTGYIVPDENYETDVEGGIDDTGSWVWTYDTHAAGARINSILDGTFVPLESQNQYGESSDTHDDIPKGSKVSDLQ